MLQPPGRGKESKKPHACEAGLAGCRQSSVLGSKPAPVGTICWSPDPGVAQW